ncbi:hypothetical protein [Ruegeria sp. MALMAid1280]|uniref:hypothetical protein n=1 Tax=Ruegeria sp. MALMAid1280 TaxID=3411634 RepID=UPI003BA17BAB
MRWDLVIGGLGLCLSAVALKPILFPPPPDCKPIMAQLTFAEQDKGSARVSLNAAQQKLKQLRSDQSANSSKKSRVEGFLQEQDFADEMRAYAHALSSVASDFDERFEIFQPITDKTFINVARDRPQLVNDFKTALAAKK